MNHINDLSDDERKLFIMIDIERLHECYKETNNPLFVWEAINIGGAEKERKEDCLNNFEYDFCTSEIVQSFNR